MQVYDTGALEENVNNSIQCRNCRCEAKSEIDPAAKEGYKIYYYFFWSHTCFRRLSLTARMAKKEKSMAQRNAAPTESC